MDSQANDLVDMGGCLNGWSPENQEFLEVGSHLGSLHNNPRKDTINKKPGV